MKRLFVIGLLVLCITDAAAQFKQLIYGNNKLPQSTHANPSTQIEPNFYVLMPVLSGIGAQAEFYGISIYDVFRADRNMEQTVDELTSFASPNDLGAIETKINLIEIGFTHRGFNSDKQWSFGAYQQNYGYSYFPKDPIDLLLEGNELDRSYEMKHLHMSAQSLMTYHAGLSWNKHGSKWYWGVRGKLYNAIASIKSTGNRGSLTTRINNNSWVDILADGRFGYQSSGLEDLNGNSLAGQAFFSGNMGLGLDFGLTYLHDQNWTFSASVLDLGAFIHNKGIQGFTTNGRHLFTGVTLIDPGNLDIDNWDDALARLEEDLSLDSTLTRFTSYMPTQIHLQASYKWGKDKFTNKHPQDDCNCAHTYHMNKKSHEVGALLHLINRNARIYPALSLYYHGNFTEKFSLRASYSLGRDNYSNLGAAINYRAGIVQFFLGVENLYGLTQIERTPSLGAHFGMNLIWL